MNEKGIAITFNNFKVWTKMYPWEEYDEIKIENTQWSQHSQVIFTMTFVKKKRNIYVFSISIDAPPGKRGSGNNALSFKHKIKYLLENFFPWWSSQFIPF